MHYFKVLFGWFPNLTRAYDNNGRCPRQKFVLAYYTFYSSIVQSLHLSSFPSAVPTMRFSHDSSRLPFCLFFGRFTSPGSFWIFFSFRSSLTYSPFRFVM